MPKNSDKTILVFDLSTIGRFPKHQLRFAYVYDVSKEAYEFYPLEEVGRLIARLQSADLVISYNGTTFDVPLLRKRYGLSGKFPRNGDHLDLRQIGLGKGLDKAADSELGERKRRAGQSLESLKAACQHDISLTLQLWRRYETESLDIQLPPPHNPILDQVGWYGLDFYSGKMSDGELAEYLALVEGGGDEDWWVGMAG